MCLLTVSSGGLLSFGEMQWRNFTRAPNHNKKKKMVGKLSIRQNRQQLKIGKNTNNNNIKKSH